MAAAADSRPVVHVVHCVDTEGPLEEPLEATFDRLRHEMGIDLAPSIATLRALQAEALDLGGAQAAVARFLAPGRLAYLSSWNAVEDMVSAVTDPCYRRAHADPEGNPYIFSWFIIDVVGYSDNPRRKAVGWNVIWDNYARFLAGRAANDSLGWHFHTVPVGRHALHYNPCWTNNDVHEQALARRLIQRGWFPSIFRAGGMIERWDLSAWLEQFIPFDFSNRAIDGPGAGGPGVECDWRGAPTDWRPYHPHHDDYRRRGAMRRWIFRCLDIDTPDCALARDDVERAFATAAEDGQAILAYSDHDRRDLRPDIDKALAHIRSVAGEHPEIRWRFSSAHAAARAALGAGETAAPRFSHRFDGKMLMIESDQALFGPLPFLGVEEEGEVFYRDNPTIEDERRWAYRSNRWDKVRRIGIAGSNASGHCGVHVIEGTR
jgi:hypothetical protein